MLRDVDGIDPRDDIGVHELPGQFGHPPLSGGAQPGIAARPLRLFGMPHEDHRRRRLRLEKPGQPDGNRGVDDPYL